MAHPSAGTNKSTARAVSGEHRRPAVVPAPALQNRAMCLVRPGRDGAEGDPSWAPRVELGSVKDLARDVSVFRQFVVGFPSRRCESGEMTDKSNDPGRSSGKEPACLIRARTWRYRPQQLSPRIAIFSTCRIANDNSSRASAAALEPSIPSVHPSIGRLPLLRAHWHMPDGSSELVLELELNPLTEIRPLFYRPRFHLPCPVAALTVPAGPKRR